MGTTAKGERFEAHIHKAFSKLIEDGAFLFPADCCRIFRRKGYYSKDREREIVFDVSIEVFLPGQSSRSLLVLIECKDYKHRVPVDDAEEFYAKAQQISPAATKAILVSSNAFQEGAFSFARSKGIGLVRYFHGDRIEWLLTRSPSSSMVSMPGQRNTALIYEALRQKGFISRCLDFYCYSNGAHTASINECLAWLIEQEAPADTKAFLSELQRTECSPPSVVPYKTESEIEALANLLRMRAGYASGPVDLEKICAELQREIGLTVRDRELPSGVLGTTTFVPPTIELDRNKCADARRVRFTLAHEIGHVELGHGKYIIREMCRDDDLDTDLPSHTSVKDIQRLEWQANYFASCLLLPKDQLLTVVRRAAERLNVSDRGHGLIYLDSQHVNVEIFLSLTAPVMNEFAVSRSVVKVALKRLGLLREVQDVSVSS